MLKNKLICLDYPNPESVNVNDAVSFRKLILWLEDQKIRRLKIEERAGLRNINSNDWPKVFENYKNELDCPKELKSELDQLKWLLNHAIKLEYMDNVDDYRNITLESTQKSQQSSAPSIKSVNPFDTLDFHSKEFEAGVRKLAEKLLIPYHPDHLLVLSAISKVIKDNLNKEALKQAIPKGQPFPLIFEGPGMDEADKDVEQAARILRLLQIQSIREMQTLINESIVETQSLITDAPKTDTRLGQVGR